MRVLTPDADGLAAAFGCGAEVAPLAAVPRVIRPRLEELEDMTAATATLTLGRDPCRGIIAVLDGDDSLRHLRFAADGRVARGSGEPPLYVAKVEDLPPF